MEELIEYLRKTYTITKEDLALPDDERNFLLGQLAMIDEVESLYLNGYTNEEDV